MAKFDITKFAEALPDRADLPDSGMTREIPVGDILDNPRNFYPRPDNKALAALLSCSRQGLFYIPAVLILPQLLQLLGIQSAQSVSDFLAFLFAIPFTISFFKRLRRLQEQEKAKGE